MKKNGQALLGHYKLGARRAHYNATGCRYWSLEQFPGVYFDASGYILFSTEKDYSECPYLQIGPVSTRVRDKEAGISGIPGYVRLDPAPGSLRKGKCSHCGATALLPERYIPVGVSGFSGAPSESSSGQGITNSE